MKSPLFFCLPLVPCRTTPLSASSEQRMHSSSGASGDARATPHMCRIMSNSTTRAPATRLTRHPTSYQRVVHVAAGQPWRSALINPREVSCETSLLYLQLRSLPTLPLQHL